MNRKVKIGGHEYEIETVKPIDMDGCWGLVQHANCKIKLSDEIQGSRKDETLSHEILHALFQNSGLGQYLKNKEVNEEEVLCMFENNFYRFLVENTNFFGD